MNFLYLINIDPNIKEFVGVNKKIEGQIKAFTEKNINIDLKSLYEKVTYGIIDKINKRVNLFSPTYGKYHTNIDYRNYDYIYIRHCPVDFYFIKLLKKIKRENSKVKILMEIPTYPYNREFDIKTSHALIKDIIFTRSLRDFVYRIITFSNDDKIYNIPTIKIDNGIDLENIEKKKNIFFDGKNLNIIAVANISFWHGYDRLIKGLYNFYNNEASNKIHINFYIVGSGLEVDKLKKLVQRLGLDNNVFFCGFKTGKELDEIYDFCHIAVDHLGVHRKGLDYLSSLKSKEYCSRGIPFILSHNDNAFKNASFIHKVESNDNDLNIEEIVQFTSKTLIGNYTNSIRDYSKKFSWSKIIDKIVYELTSC